MLLANDRDDFTVQPDAPRIRDSRVLAFHDRLASQNHPATFGQMVAQLADYLLKLQAMVEAFVEPDQLVFLLRPWVVTKPAVECLQPHLKKVSLPVHEIAKRGRNIDGVDVDPQSSKCQCCLTKPCAVLERPVASLEVGVPQDHSRGDHMIRSRGNGQRVTADKVGW